MTRRAVLAALLSLGLPVAPRVAGAQPTARIARIGFLALGAPTSPSRARETFRRGLRDLGYEEGKNLVIEFRDAGGAPERLPAAAAELAALKVDVILAGGGTLGAMAAKNATRAIPIVFGAVGDPVGEGLVASVARPGGNVTGLAVLSPELAVKSLELLKQAVPRLIRVALLLKPDAMPDRALRSRVEATEAGARTLGLRLQVVEARRPEDFDRAFSDMAKASVGAVSVLATPVFDAHRERLVELASKDRLPAVYSFARYVEIGGLMSYGPDISDLYRRAATYVDKILKGASPGDLPVEQPTKFELAINLRTARALGLTMPATLLQRADQVIE